MNYWVNKSIQLAKNANYLDRLLDVYPVHLDVPKKGESKEYKIIKSAFKNRNRKGLLLELLKLKRFPVDDPYIGFLRRDRSAINRNPKTIKRITGRLFKTGITELIAGVEQAKSPSRRFGQLFRVYLKTLRIPVVSAKDFKKKRIAILEGSDATLKNFAAQELGYRGDKGLDLVLKINKQFYIGETKFISTPGGTQDKSFRETMTFINKPGKFAKRIAILDGVVWLTNSTKKQHTNLYSNLLKLKSDQLVMSALLLKEFIASAVK